MLKEYDRSERMRGLMTRLRIRSMPPGEQKAAWVCQMHWRRYCGQLALNHDEVYKLIRTHLDKDKPSSAYATPAAAETSKRGKLTLAAQQAQQAVTPRRGALLGGAVTAVMGRPASAAGGGGGGGSSPSPHAVDSVKIARDFARLEKTVQEELAEMRQSMLAFHEGVQRSLEAIVSTQQKQHEPQQQASLGAHGTSSSRGSRGATASGTGAPTASTRLFLEA